MPLAKYLKNHKQFGDRIHAAIDKAEQADLPYLDIKYLLEQALERVIESQAERENKNLRNHLEKE